MPRSAKKSQPVKRGQGPEGYGAVLEEITELLRSARRTAACAVNTVMTSVYWEVGRRIVEYEQEGEARAAYGEKLLERQTSTSGVFKLKKAVPLRSDKHRPHSPHCHSRRGPSRVW
jgi:hypothetical protein